MNRVILRRFFLLRIALVLAAAPVLGQERADAVLVLADDGALEAPAVHAIRNVAASELRKRGIALADERRTPGVQPIDESLLDVAQDLGARRIFALRVGGRLGQKVPLSLDELSADTLAPVYSASLTATGLEECDVVTARLVDAVLGRRSAEATAQMTTVTATESKPFAKKPGERFWFIGLPVGLYNSGASPAGFSLGYGYEAENFRISVTGALFARGGDGVAYGAMEGTWIPLATEFSPFIGAGLGYMAAGGRGGLGGLVEGGIEAFRLHGVRALAGVQLAIPFFDTTESFPSLVAHRSMYPAGFVRLAF
ncbi:MAG: hypothetical protein ACXWLR_01400 [Myxococcales bacterium]